MLAPIPVPGLSEAELDSPVVFAPLRRPAELRLTPEQMALLCSEHLDAADLALEADGRVVEMTPAGSEPRARTSRLTMRLWLWAAELWPASAASTRLEQATLLDAGPDVPGLQLDLEEIWAG